MAGRIHYLRYLFTLKKMSLDQLLTIRRQRRLRHERRMVCKKTLVKQMPRADTTTRLPMSSRTSFFFFTNFYLVKTRGPNFAALAPYVTPRQESGSKLLIQLWTRKWITVESKQLLNHTFINEIISTSHSRRNSLVELGVRKGVGWKDNKKHGLNFMTGRLSRDTWRRGLSHQITPHTNRLLSTLSEPITYANNHPGVCPCVLLCLCAGVYTVTSFPRTVCKVFIVL